MKLCAMNEWAMALVWAVVLSVAGGLSAEESAAASGRPNVVMVFIDDMGWADLSCFGQTDAKTPHIDRLAAEGMRFTQFYVNSPICSPSRCALTTGQYPQRWRITSYLNHRADNERRGMAQWLDPQAPTLARLLKQAGYATGHFGKWHLGGQRDVDDAPPITAYGFDESLTNFEGMGAKLLPLTLRPGEAAEGRIWGDAERLGGPVVWMQRSQITRGFVEAAIPFMDRAVRKGQPFYLNLWPDDVHGPWWPPVDKWAEGKRGLYLAVLEAMDQQLGRLFEHIRATPALSENTLILLCSDNGHEPGAGSGGRLRGAKTQLYEGGIRSPLIVWGPRWMAAERVGTVNEQSVFSAIDLVPSVLELAEVEVPAGLALDGEALWDTLVGKAEGSRQAALCWRRPPDRKSWPPHLPEEQSDLAIRLGNWKLLCEYDGSRPHLYDLKQDEGEERNVAEANPAVVAQLTREVVAWHRALPADSGPALAEEGRAGKSKGKGKGKASAK
jgi:arylsulfatase A-like enzyme